MTTLNRELKQALEHLSKVRDIINTGKKVKACDGCKDCRQFQCPRYLSNGLDDIESLVEEIEITHEWLGAVTKVAV